METHHNKPSMNQKIFDFGLSVEMISLYLLCCGLVDEGRRISINTIRQIWNGSEEALHTGLSGLVKRNIIQKILSDDEGNNAFYNLVGVEQWTRL